MSDFGGLSLALTSLQAQQRSVDVAAQNVANANTAGLLAPGRQPGEHRRPAIPAFYSTFTGDGQGVKVDSVTRFRDQFMEIQAALEHGSMASLDQANATMKQIQQLFNEPSDSGHPRAALGLLVGLRRRRQQPGRHRARARSSCEQADTLAASFNSVSQSLLQQKARHETAQLGATRRRRSTRRRSRVAQLNQAIKSEHDRRPPRQRPRGPARPARATSSRSQRRDDPAAARSTRST